MKSYLYAVQRESGHEIISAVVDVAKVSEVTPKIDPDTGIVSLLHKRTELGRSADPVEPGETVQFLRWPADDKLSDPVAKPITR